MSNVVPICAYFNSFLNYSLFMFVCCGSVNIGFCTATVTSAMLLLDLTFHMSLWEGRDQKGIEGQHKGAI